MSGFMAATVVAFAATYVALLLVALRRPLLARLALREAVRRPWQSALLVLGLMLGAAAILSMQSIADYAALDEDAYRGWGRVDLTIDARGRFFSPEVGDRLGDDAELRSRVVGVQAGVELAGAVGNLDRGLGKPDVRIVGFDPTAQAAFGAYELADGRRTLGGDLEAGDALLSSRLARDLEARVGDRLRVSVGRRGALAMTELRVAGIALGRGPGAYGGGALRHVRAVFVPLAALRPLGEGDQINVVRVSTGVEGEAGLAAARETLPLVRSALADAPGAETLDVRAPKAAAVERLRNIADLSRGWFLALSLFVVLVGAVLVVNLALALGEERRPRLAVLRALGLTRPGLVMLALMEGAVYALAAAIAGGAVGALLSALFLSPGSRGGALQLSTVVFSLAAASLANLAALLAVSLRTSRLAIAAAVKDLPDPASAERPSWTRRLALGALGLASLAAVVAGTPDVRFAGGVGLLGLTGALARGHIRDRLRATIVGVGLTAWALAYFSTLTKADPYGPGVFFMTLPTLVFGLSIVLAANLPLLDGLADTVAAVQPRLCAVLRPPLAYLTRRPLRTGLGTGAFALVLAVLTGIGAYVAIAGPDYDRDTAGYDVRVVSWSGGSLALPAAIATQVTEQLSLPSLRYAVPTRDDLSLTLHPIPDEDLAKLRLRLIWRDPRFESDADAWEAVRKDPRWYVDRNPWAHRLTVPGPEGPVELRQAGAIASEILPGVIASQAALAPFTGVSEGAVLLLRLRPEVDPATLAQEIRRALFAEGVDAATTRELLDETARSGSILIDRIDLVLRTGLVVGVVSLGILALRAAIERRRVIGVLRALGYRPADVLGGFLAEAMLTAAGGILVGTVSGAVAGYVLASALAGPFALDAARTLSAVALVVIGVLVAALGPAMRAARLPPAEAIRLFD